MTGDTTKSVWTRWWSGSASKEETPEKERVDVRAMHCAGW
jgi:hypothetical protein